jgi:hypothetical protein
VRRHLNPLIRDYLEDLDTPVGELLRRYGVSGTMLRNELGTRGIRAFGHSRRHMMRRGIKLKPPLLSPAKEARLRARYCLPGGSLG